MFSLTFAQPLVLLLLPVVLGWAAWLWLGDQGNLSRLRHRLALVLRLLIMGALILVLAGATWLQPEQRQATVFVADLSASMAGLPDREAAFIAQALKARGREDVAAVVSVGADALIEQPVAALTGFAGFQSVVDRSATNLEQGLNLAGALFPVGYRKRVVLLTDGQQNTGDVLGAARLLREEGVRLDVVPLAPGAGPEALVSDVQTQPTLHRGEHVPLSITLHSSVAQAATLDVFDGATQLRRLTLSLAAGDTHLTLSLPALGSGFHRLRVLLHPSSDTLSENNEGAAVTRVLGAPRVLVAEGSPGEGNIVAAALRARGMQVRQEADTLIEPTTAYLSNFDAVVLVDVPAFDLDPVLLDPVQSPLRSYVDGGGGLVVLGGPNSYGVGGYADTTFDDILPVSMKLPQRKDTPSVAVALIIEDLETQTNVNISKVAGEGVIKLLTPLDQIAVNDANGTDAPNNGWAVPLQYVTNKAAINHAIDNMNPTDPMSYKPSLVAAYNVLRHAKAKIKHIVLLGDGDAEDTYYPLITKIRKAGITVSTVATGGGAGGFGADYATMMSIARWGGGHYYPSDNVAAIPQIFLKETKQIARTGIVEEHFTPQLVNDSPIVAGVPGAPLDGYVATTPKGTGEQVLMHLTKHGLDPLLAQWQYGLGRVVAWTSDARGQWTKELIASGQGNRLWSNMVSWVLPPASSPNLAASTSLAGGRAHLTVTTNGLPYNASVTARVDGPAHSTSVTLAPTAPGQYEADVPASSAGAYFLGIQARVGGRVRASLRTGLVVPYAAEYRSSGLDAPLLAQAAAAGHGVLLSDPARSFADNLAQVYAPRPLTTPLLLLALLLLPFDVGVRRLLIGLAELRAAWAALARRRALATSAVPAGTVAAPLTTVRARRATRRERVAEGRAAAPTLASSARSTTPATPTTPSPQASSATARPSAMPATTQMARVATPTTSGRTETPTSAASASPSVAASSSSSPAPASTEPSATTSRLLEAKRKRRGG